MNAAPELVLTDEPDAAATARTFVARVLGGASDALLANARLVVTELVTNAILHGAQPVSVRVTTREDAVHVEVEDAGRSLPFRARARNDAMTGRGLDLVASLSRHWGIEPGTRGKVVWADVVADDQLGVSAGALLDADTLLARWSADEAAERYEVCLGAVPTDFLIAAKVHIDNVVRELTLLRSDCQARGEALPRPMAALITAVTEDFAEARADIKRQAVEASQRGEQVTDLVLKLPLSAADAGERYLAALEEVDRHARAARMLTLAPPRSHQAFRRWYVGALIDQLRAAAAGHKPTLALPFPQVLAAEIDRLATLEESWGRLQLLQRITAELTGAATVDQISEVVVRHAGAHSGVQGARVFVLTERRTLRSIARYGGLPSGGDQDEFPLDADVPAAVVARTGEPLFLRSLVQLQRRFPDLGGYVEPGRSLHISPLSIGGHVLGVLALTFAGDEVDDEGQVAFMRAIADVLAQAIDRAQATQRVDAERGRDLILLNAQLDVLAAIVAGQPLGVALDALLLAVEGVSPDGMLGSILLLDEDGLHLRHCAAPSLPAFYNEAIDGVAIGSSVGSCGTAAYRREQVIVEDVTVDPLWRDFRELALAAGLRACWSTPIFGRKGRLLGTFAWYYPQPQRPSPADLAFMDVLVRTVTMAIERSQADEERERALAAERAAALTLQHSMLPAVPSSLGPVRLEARYRTGDPGVEVGGDWFDALATADAVTLVVGDVQGHDLQAAALMGQLRTVARSAAMEGHSPAGIVAALHRYLEGVDTELLTTALVVHLDTDGGTATVASAGHLPPLLMTFDDDLGWQAADVDLDVGPPLGLGESWDERSTVLPPDAMLLMYTDGLVETRTWPLDHGLTLLRKAMESLPEDVSLSDVLDTALALVPTGSRGDDVAVLAARVSRT